jgi:hypothetical protein
MRWAVQLPKDSIEQQMGRQVNADRKQQHQEQDEKRRGHFRLRLLAEPVNPVDVLPRVAERREGHPDR